LRPSDSTSFTTVVEIARQVPTARERTMLRRKLILTATAAVALATARSSKSFAAPVSTIDGVTFPTGVVPGGNVFESATINETSITGPGQQLQGVGLVTAITDGSSNIVWQNGNNGAELAYEFSGYTSNVVTPPSSTPGQISFTGGTLSYYVLPAGKSISTGSVAGDIATVESGTLFLNTSASLEDVSGDTLIETIPANSTLNSFSAASDAGFLDINSGAAAADFNTNTFADPFDSANGGFADESFAAEVSSGASGDFPVSGSGTFKANAVPEPVSGLMCLTGLLLLARRKSRSV
jgi:hypothetical protein